MGPLSNLGVASHLETFSKFTFAVMFGVRPCEPVSWYQKYSENQLSSQNILAAQAFLIEGAVQSARVFEVPNSCSGLFD